VAGAVLCTPQQKVAETYIAKNIVFDIFNVPFW
jgi:hypothetical protein